MIKYVVYEDFVFPKVLKICSTKKEACRIKKCYPNWSEVWIKKVDVDVDVNVATSNFAKTYKFCDPKGEGIQILPEWA